MSGSTCSLLLACLVLLAGCANVAVRPVSPELRMTEVVLRENTRMTYVEVAEVIKAGFDRHGIRVRIMAPAERQIAPGAFVVSYTAYEAWDFSSYLCDAAILIDRDGKRVAQGIYHLKNKGGAALNKWAAVRAKLDPVMDALLKDYPVASVRSQGPTP